MNYQSTRDTQLKVSASKAITQGISSEGGLFVPEVFPRITEAEWGQLEQLSYNGRAKLVLGKFLTDFTAEELESCIDNAYTSEKFDCADRVALHPLSERATILELWHGPTCAFKDMALQLLPHLLTTSAKHCGEKREIVILVATSGDTGKAALEGFKDVSGTKMLVFYPEDGVSAMQKLQMATQEGENLSVCAIHGNFDDAQSAVKEIFTSEEIKGKLAKKGMAFSSANSINWGRLAPQIVYYISAYCDLCKEGKVKRGEKVNICVPTGNFGNILAAYYAGKMGLPVQRFICASNRNNVLTDFLETGTYDRKRAFFTTLSPSMDILISSNLERLLFDLSGGDAGKVVSWFEALARDGSYTVDAVLKEKLQSYFVGGFCDDVATGETIAKVFGETGYTLDTHTAVAVKVYEDYVERTGDHTQTIIASTASPYKFAGSVLKAITGDDVEEGDFQTLEALFAKTGLPVPKQLAELQGKVVRFHESCEKAAIGDFVEKTLAL